MALVETIRRKIHEMSPARSVYEMGRLTGRIDDTFAQDRARTVLLTAFALIAVTLAAVGLYGTMSYVVSARRREVGLRMAMGARPEAVASQFLLQGLRVAMAGAIVGLGVSALLRRAIAGVLYGVSPLDPTTFAAVVVFIVSTSVLASLWPALRRTRSDSVLTRVNSNFSADFMLGCY